MGPHSCGFNGDDSDYDRSIASLSIPSGWHHDRDPPLSSLAMGKSTAIGPLTGRSRLLPPSGYGGAVEKVVEAQGEVKAASVMAAATTTTSCGDSATATATTSYNDNVTGEWELARVLDFGFFIFFMIFLFAGRRHKHPLAKKSNFCMRVHHPHGKIMIFIDTSGYTDGQLLHAKIGFGRIQ